MLSTFIPLPLAPSLPMAAIVFGLPIGWILGLTMMLMLALTATLQHIRALPQAKLRLVPTANAWGFSERAQLDESAVGL